MKPIIAEKNYLPFLLALSALLLIPSLGKTPLWIYDEVRNAECAREMWERGDWIVPTFNGGLRTLKPPLHYWFMFGGFELFGVTEWGARFFSALFGMATIAITYLFVRRWSTPLHAFLSAAVLLASTHFLFEFRMSVPDPYLIFFNTLSIFTAYQYFTEKKFWALMVAAVSFGLGILAKGPVAVALPGLGLFCWLLWDKRWKQIFTLHLIPAAVVMLAVAVPWYWAVHRATNGEWTRGFFLEHNVGRFSEPMEGHGGLFLIVPLFVLLGLLPASAWIGEAFKKFRDTYNTSLLKLAFSVTSAFVVFYSVSGTKLPNYPMPCYPLFAVLLAFVLLQLIQRFKQPKIYPFVILLVINITLPIGLYFGIRNEVELKGSEGYAIPVAVLTITSILSIYLYRKKGFAPALFALFAGYCVFNLVFLDLIYPTVYQNNPMSKTIGRIDTTKPVVGYKLFHPSFTYYLPHRVPMLHSAQSLDSFIKQNPATIILTRQSYLEELKALELDTIGIHHDLFESSTTAVMRSKK